MDWNELKWIGFVLHMFMLAVCLVLRRLWGSGLPWLSTPPGLYLWTTRIHRTVPVCHFHCEKKSGPHPRFGFSLTCTGTPSLWRQWEVCKAKLKNWRFAKLTPFRQKTWCFSQKRSGWMENFPSNLSQVWFVSLLKPDVICFQDRPDSSCTIKSAVFMRNIMNLSDWVPKKHWSGDIIMINFWMFIGIWWAHPKFSEDPSQSRHPKCDRRRWTISAFWRPSWNSWAMPAVAATPRIKPQQLLVSPKRSFRYELIAGKRGQLLDCWTCRTSKIK